MAASSTLTGMSTNRFPTTCTKPSCGRRIDAGKGTHTGKVAGRHTYVHTGTCDGSLDLDPTPSATFPAGISERYYSRVADLVRAAGDNVEVAWGEFFMENEGFDGEPVITASAKLQFFQTAAAYLNHPDIIESREFALREALAEAEVYEAELAEMYR